MKKKKLLLAVVTLCLAFSMAACGNKTVTEADVETWSDEDFEKAFEKLDASESAKKEDSAKATTSEALSYEPKQEIIDADWNSGLFQINDTLVQLPIRLSDWIKLGFDYNPVSVPKDYLYSSGEYMSFDLLVNNEKICTIFNVKRTDEGYGTLEETDPLIEQVSLSKVNILTNKVFAPGNLQFGESFKTIEETFGKPLLIEDVGYYPNEKMEYRYGSVGETVDGAQYGLYVGAGKSTQEIEYVRIGKNIDSCSYDEFAAISLPFWGGNQSFLWLPTYISSGNDIHSVLEYNGQTYLISMKTNVYSPDTYSYRGKSIFEETDENGVFRYVYTEDWTPNQFHIEYVSNEHFFSGFLTIENISYVPEEDAPIIEKFKDLAIEITKSVQMQ